MTTHRIDRRHYRLPTIQAEAFYKEVFPHLHWSREPFDYERGPDDAIVVLLKAGAGMTSAHYLVGRKEDD